MQKLINQKLINLTPHTINIVSQEGKEFNIPPSGQVLRVAQRLSQTAPLFLEAGKVDTWAFEGFEEVKLPPQEEGKIYLVSLPTLIALKAQGVRRIDIVAPDTGRGAIRNDKGQVVAVRRLLSLC